MTDTDDAVAELECRQLEPPTCLSGKIQTWPDFISYAGLDSASVLLEWDNGRVIIG